MKSRPSMKTPLSCSRLARVIVLSEARRASLAPARPPATIGASGAFPTRLPVSRRIAGSRLPGLSRQVQSTAGGRRLLGRRRQTWEEPRTAGRRRRRTEQVQRPRRRRPAQFGRDDRHDSRAGQRLRSQRRHAYHRRQWNAYDYRARRHQQRGHDALVKRAAFQHEREVRYLTNGQFLKNRVSINEPRVTLPLDPAAFIEGVIVDPRAEDWYLEAVADS